MRGMGVRISLRWRETRRQRHREAADQAFGPPVELGFAAELRLDTGDYASGSEPSGQWLLNKWPTGFLPRQIEMILRDVPLDRETARQGRQRPILGGIGDQF